MSMAVFNKRDSIFRPITVYHMLRICHDMIQGELDEFVLPTHIQQIIDFMQGDVAAECR